MHSEQRRKRHDIVPFLVTAGTAFHSEVIGVYQFFMAGRLHQRRLMMVLW